MALVLSCLLRITLLTAVQRVTVQLDNKKWARRSMIISICQLCLFYHALLLEGPLTRLSHFACWRMYLGCVRPLRAQENSRNIKPNAAYPLRLQHLVRSVTLLDDYLKDIIKPKKWMSASLCFTLCYKQEGLLVSTCSLIACAENKTISKLVRTRGSVSM